MHVEESRWNAAPLAAPSAAAAAVREYAPRPTSYTGASDRRADRPGARVREGDRQRFLELVLGGDEGAPGAFLDALVAGGTDVAAVYLDLISPTAVALGRMWEDDACDFVDVTVAVGRLQRAVRRLGEAFVFGRTAATAEAGGSSPDAARTGRALLSCVPGDQHTLGLYMVAEFLLRDGWSVRVDTPSTGQELAALLRAEWFDVVGFSAACDVRLLALRHEVAAVRRHSRNPHVRVLVGGRIFAEHPDLADRVGADGFATSAADAPSRARALVPPGPH